MTTIRKVVATRIGLLATSFIIALQLFNGLACYNLTIVSHIAGLGLVSIAFLPGLISLLSKNPLRAAGAAALFAPWLILAYYMDCVLPPKGPASSMSYLVVVVYGFPSAAIGALVTGPIFRLLHINISDA